MRHPLVFRPLLPALLIAAALMTSWARAADEDAAPSADAANKDSAITVTVTTARAQTVEDWRRAVGRLEAVATPTIAAEVAGRIAAITVDEGDTVTKGQVLARIDDTDYRLAVERARAGVKQAQAMLRGARLKLERLRKLVATGSAPRSRLDDAQAVHDDLAARLAAAEAALAQARRQLAKTEIISPVSGRVQTRFVSAGDFIAAGRPVFALVDTRHLRARLPFAETLAGALRPGLPVKLTSPVAPKITVTARIDRILPAIDPAARAVWIIADVTNPGSWRPGASVAGEVRITRHENAVVVPAVSVVLRPQGPHVYVLEGDVARARPVRTGLVLDGAIEILSGLEAGESVIVHGAGFVVDGMRVRVKTGGEPRT